MRSVDYNHPRLPSGRGYVRGGLTLIEVAIVVSIGALLTGIAVTALAALLHADREIHTRAARRPQVTSLAVALRRDIAQAEAVAWDEDKQLLQLSLANNAMLGYRELPDRWERREFSDESGAESGDKLTLALPAPRRLMCRVEPAEAAAGELVRIILSTGERTDPEQAPQPVLEIVALVGRDGRLLQE